MSRRFVFYLFKIIFALIVVCVSLIQGPCSTFGCPVSVTTSEGTHHIHLEDMLTNDQNSAGLTDNGTCWLNMATHHLHLWRPPHPILNKDSAPWSLMQDGSWMVLSGTVALFLLHHCLCFYSNTFRLSLSPSCLNLLCTAFYISSYLIHQCPSLLSAVDLVWT